MAQLCRKEIANIVVDRLEFKTEFELDWYIERVKIQTVGRSFAFMVMQHGIQRMLFAVAEPGTTIGAMRQNMASGEVVFRLIPHGAGRIVATVAVYGKTYGGVDNNFVFCMSKDNIEVPVTRWTTLAENLEKVNEDVG